MRMSDGKLGIVRIPRLFFGGIDNGMQWAGVR